MTNFLIISWCIRFYIGKINQSDHSPLCSAYLNVRLEDLDGILYWLMRQEDHKGMWTAIGMLLVLRIFQIFKEKFFHG